MAYTIKGLAKANDCEELNEFGLAQIWSKWLEYDCCDQKSLNDFKRLRKADRQLMLNLLSSDACWVEIHTHICANLF